LTYALRLEGLASVLVGMRRYEHLRENVDTVACLAVTRQS
jgi:aryl-alcohol dehydrogenase-like predicted oxidoreductase